MTFSSVDGVLWIENGAQMHDLFLVLINFQIVRDFSTASDSNRNLFDRVFLFLRCDWSTQDHIAVVRDDLDVLPLDGHLRRINDAFANLCDQIDIRLIV